jgi:hypothetical protein
VRSLALRFGQSFSRPLPGGYAAPVKSPDGGVHGDRSHQLVLKKFLVVGLLMLGIAAVAVLLFYAGDHDDEYHNSLTPDGHPSPVEIQPASPHVIAHPVRV